MNEQVLKVGNGWLWGVSSDHAQPGKTITLSDGENVICSIQLGIAFPTRAFILEDGTEESEPGMVIGHVFVTDLRAKTDGHDLDIFWR